MSDRISNSEDSVDLIELITAERQLFFHTAYIGIIEICSVKVVEEVHQIAKGQDEEIKLDDELSLTWRSRFSSEVLQKGSHCSQCRAKDTMATAWAQLNIPKYSDRGP